jgi:hypothetical protein
VFGPALAWPTATDPPSAVAGPPIAPGIDQPDGPFAGAPDIVLGPLAQGPSAMPDPSMADPLSSTDSALAAIAAVAPDVRILVSASVLALAGAAMIGPRAGGSGADVSMAFTNVRLLPCVVKASLERHIDVLKSVLAANGGSAAAAPSQATDLASSAAGTRSASPHEDSGLSHRARTAFGNAFESFHDGFEQAIGEGQGDVGEGLRDSRLMMQVGMLLGFVYLGFLTVWFWATRGREARRPGAM